MPLYIFARFEPRPGKRAELLDELRRVSEPTRDEPGCTRVNVYESTRDPCYFFIHSEWIDEEAFEVHARQPHVIRFLGLVDELITHPFHAARTKQIG
jgi:quinol monooxygenase YgiN